jgi:mRNA interferase MazF
MGQFVKGDIVVLPFPFSDLSDAKKRPAYVLATLPFNDILLCQITSQNTSDPQSIILETSDFTSGSLPITSYIRPLRIFCADSKIVLKKAGHVRDDIHRQVVKSIFETLSL